MAVKHRQSGLGRGLNAIFDLNVSNDDYTVASETISNSAVCELDLSKIDPNPNQPRSNFDIDAIDELAQSIKSLGVIQPITVKSVDYGRYIIISGERRYKAAKKVGLEKIPVYIHEVDDQTLLEMALVENIQREDLNPLEIALSLDRLITECNITQEKLSERVGKNRATISNYIRLLKLSPKIQLALSKKEISMGHAKAILSIDSTDMQDVIMNKIIKEALSVRQTEQILKSLSEEKQVVKKQSTELPISTQLFEQKLTDIFGTKILISRSTKGESKIIMNFKNDKEIEDILNKLNR